MHSNMVYGKISWMKVLVEGQGKREYSEYYSLLSHQNYFSYQERATKLIFDQRDSTHESIEQTKKVFPIIDAVWLRIKFAEFFFSLSKQTLHLKGWIDTFSLQPSANKESKRTKRGYGFIGESVRIICRENGLLTSEGRGEGLVAKSGGYSPLRC